jgi:hypothetical protein
VQAELCAGASRWKAAASATGTVISTGPAEVSVGSTPIPNGMSSGRALSLAKFSLATTMVDPGGASTAAPPSPVPSSVMKLGWAPIDASETLNTYPA